MEIDDLVQMNDVKKFKIEYKTNKNNLYFITFTLGSNLKIEATQVNDIIKKLFANKFTFKDITENKYFLQFDALKEIFIELNDIIHNSKIFIEENENNLKIR